ncbi:uncharacterized protein LOC141601503 [Silene latifolia]|uniref:uncharacterized protein LOC141601503 n=1 Tax=Silene latifolia TaxID=37657 RepID=UPI003D7848B8
MGNLLLRIYLYYGIEYQILLPVVSLFVVIGDFNQVELHFDKLGGSTTIRGQDDFLAWKLNNNLIDVPFFGPRFTWSNCQRISDCIMERLDRAYATQYWFQLFPSASVLHLPILISDHPPIILSFFPSAKPSKRPYRVDNWCLTIPEVMDLVILAWNTPVTGSSIYVLSRKLAAVRYAILTWVIKHRITNRINWSYVEYELDTSLGSITDCQMASAYHDLRSEQLQMITKQHDYCLQCIEAEILRYFKDLLGTHKSQASISPYDNYDHFLNPLDLPSLTPVDCSLMTSPLMEGDVFRELHGMDGSKSPGPDGITPRFFQVFWPQVGHLVTSAILRFLNTGVTLNEWNITHIVLLPKVDRPELVSQYRPISLCNVIYRLASKCLANLIKQVITSLISDTQEAFVPGRLMSDSSIIAHEIMHYVNKTKKGYNCYAVLKLDMHKAFDRFSWHFLMAVMPQMWFPLAWCSLI